MVPPVPPASGMPPTSVVLPPEVPPEAAGRDMGPDMGLARRIPQSHLAPELRQQSTFGQPDQQPVPNGEQTREALSRYQASRQAARALVENEQLDFHDDNPDSDTAPPASDGGGLP
jgi:hypothetical protein